jgi:hypothetical protein
MVSIFLNTFLSLFSGDVVLKTLILKQSALDDLNLPVKTVAGHISKRN